MELKLPLSVVGPSDIDRLIREITSLDEFFLQSQAREHSNEHPPRLSRMLDDLVHTNTANLLLPDVRQKLKATLQQILKTAPTIHLSFAADPPPKALEKIVIWLRTNIDPNILVRVGLQPTIAAGCVLRTPNKIFDMSLRARLQSQENYMAKLIDGVVNERSK